jgi:hypothetical protein
MTKKKVIVPPNLKDFYQIYHSDQERKKRNSKFFYRDNFVWVKLGHMQENSHFYNILRLAPPARRNVLSKQGRTALSQEGQREGQELDNRMCCHHIKSEPRTQTFLLYARPHPLCVEEWGKLPPHWSCEHPTKSDLVGLFGWFSCLRTQVHVSSCDIKTSPGHSRHYLPSRMYTRFIKFSHVTQDHIGACHMQTNMKKKGKWTYEIPVRSQEMKWYRRTTAPFRTRLTTSATPVLRSPPHIAGLGRRATWKYVF